MVVVVVEVSATTVTREDIMPESVRKGEVAGVVVAPMTGSVTTAVRLATFPLTVQRVAEGVVVAVVAAVVTAALVTSKYRILKMVCFNLCQQGKKDCI